MAVTITVTVSISVTVVAQQTSSGNPLRVSEDNPRYFVDENNVPIVLVGSHTWDNGQDQGSVTFNWNTFLDNLVSWEHNFFRYWMWESPTPNGFPNLEATYPMSPLPWSRTGPGNAADGELKFDLTQFNSTYFDRVRARCIDAGNHGLYVSIMLFNGFSVADKGGGADPWPYHPFNSANNINSINGDPNADGDGYEVQDHTIQAIIDLQDDYIEHLIDAVNDLDNIMFEICNEAVGSAGSNNWEAHCIDKIQTYEATKPIQHPVFYTVEYPNGNNSILLASNAEAISPNDNITNDGTKVVIMDTDHIFGVGGNAAWAWTCFTKGAGGILYMDTYNNDFLDGSGSGHPDQNFRDNLGYIKELADLADLSDMIPQGNTGSPCSTNYCLYGGSKYICYQNDQASFTLDLTGESGTFNVRKINRVTGAIDTAQTVEGGASRTITLPDGWYGFTAYVYK